MMDTALPPRKRSSDEAFFQVDEKSDEFPHVDVIFCGEGILALNKPFDLRLDGDFSVTLEKIVRDFERTEEKMVRLDRLIRDERTEDVMLPIYMLKTRFVNQIDFATSGLIFMGLCKKSAGRLSRCFQDRSIEKWYVAVGRDSGKFEFGKSIVIRNRIDSVEGDFRMCISPEGKEAVTVALPLTNCGLGVLWLLKLETGRRHQLRLHLREVGSPIVGDATYGCDDATYCKRMLLHSYRCLLYTSPSPRDS